MDTNQLQDILVQLLNISLMLSVGLEIRVGELRKMGKRWRLLIVMLFLNFGLIPLVALIAAEFLFLPSAVMMGVLLAGFCPGGGTGTLLTRLSKGNLELSVVLLLLLTIVAVPLTPLLVNLQSNVQSVQLELGVLFQTLLIFQLLPLSFGFGLRSYSISWAENLNRLAKPLSNLVFGVLVLGLFITQGHLVFSVGWGGILAMVLVVFISLLIPLFWGNNWKDRAALSQTTGVRNLSLALLLSSSFFTNQTMISVLTYGLVMYILGLGWAWKLRKLVSEV